jgi:ribosomal protein S18 acetylase RimI-like enzyme
MTGENDETRMGDLLLRWFRPSDLNELRALNAYGLAAAGIAPADDYYADEDLSNSEETYTERTGGAMLVGEVDKRIVAMGAIRRIDAVKCELLRMRVYPDYQGRGYATAVLRLLEHEARRLGYTRIELLTGEDQHPAVDIYTRNSYRITRRETVIGIPSVRMSKKLEPVSNE